ncbi:MAG: formylglycine-generating enzyme family protein [Nitrospinota bacterium]
MDVFVDGVKRGETPLPLDIPPGKEVLLEVRRGGAWGYKKIAAGPPGEKKRIVIPVEDVFYKVAYIKGGSFMMGRNDGAPDERPAHRVSLDGFFIGVREVTRGEFGKFVSETGYGPNAGKSKSCWVFQNGLTLKEGASWKKNPGSLSGDLSPVTCVSWEDANAFAGWLSRKTGKLYRLPTEAEWEFAATAWERRGPHQEELTALKPPPKFNYCDQNCGASWAGDGDDGFVSVAPVQSYQPDTTGLYDMSGNVWEWCKDWYWREYYQKSPERNPQGPLSKSLKVVRGGSWLYPAGEAESQNRSFFERDFKSSDLGFRLVREL